MILFKTRGKFASTTPFLWWRYSVTWNVRKWIDDQALALGTPAPLYQKSSCPGKDSMLWFWGQTVSSPQTSRLSWWQQPPKESDLTEGKKKILWEPTGGGRTHTKARLAQLAHYTQPSESTPEMKSTSPGKTRSTIPGHCHFKNRQSMVSPNFPSITAPIWESDGPKAEGVFREFCMPLQTAFSARYLWANTYREGGLWLLLLVISSVCSVGQNEINRHLSSLDKQEGHFSPKATQEERAALPGDSKAEGQERKRRRHQALWHWWACQSAGMCSCPSRSCHLDAGSEQ